MHTRMRTGWLMKVRELSMHTGMREFQVLEIQLSLEGMRTRSHTGEPKLSPAT